METTSSSTHFLCIVSASAVPTLHVAILVVLHAFFVDLTHPKFHPSIAALRLSNLITCL